MAVVDEKTGTYAVNEFSNCKVTLFDSIGYVTGDRDGVLAPEFLRMTSGRVDQGINTIEDWEPSRWTKQSSDFYFWELLEKALT